MGRATKRGRGRPRKAAKRKATLGKLLAAETSVDNEVKDGQPVASTATSLDCSHNSIADTLPGDVPGFEEANVCPRDAGNTFDADVHTSTSGPARPRDESSSLSSARGRIQSRIGDMTQFCFVIKRDIDKILEEVPVDSAERDTIIVEAHQAMVSCSIILWGLNFWCPSGSIE